MFIHLELLKLLSLLKFADPHHHSSPLEDSSSLVSNAWGGAASLDTLSRFSWRFRKRAVAFRLNLLGLALGLDRVALGLDLLVGGAVGTSLGLLGGSAANSASDE